MLKKRAFLYLYSLCLGVFLSCGFTELAWATSESIISHRPGEFLQSIQNDPQAGKKIYEEFCASCHAAESNIKVGAPRFRESTDWKPYLSLSMDSLLKMADTGVGSMPPRGGCFECSDENLKAAIIYMMPLTSPN